MEQRLLITYSPKYAAYQKEIRDKQIERAKAMLVKKVNDYIQKEARR